MFYLLPITQTIPLKEEFKADNLIIFQSAKPGPTPSPGAGIEDVNINILSAAQDVLLHVSVRCTEDTIVLNSRTAEGPWGTEERAPLGGLSVGPNTTITVHDHGDRFQILIDYHSIYYYVKRIQENGAAVSYHVNENQISPPPDTLAVTTLCVLRDPHSQQCLGIGDFGWS